MSDEKCLVIFSGGLDSTTVLYQAIKDYGYDNVEVMCVDYGQRHIIELKMGKKTLELLKDSMRRLTGKYIPRHLIKSDLTQFGGSALTDDGIEPHKDRAVSEMIEGEPNTFVPGRNILMLTYAGMICELRGIKNIMGGWNILDYSGYPDCRPEFLDAMIDAINLGMFKGPYKLHFPLIHKTKAEIIKWGIELGVKYDYAISCYMGKEIPCGHCDSCILRAKGWAEMGDEDHLIGRLKAESKM